MSTLIEVNNLSKAFGNNQVLNGLAIKVGHGESLAIIGASGSGKSVLLKCILGLIPVDGGKIYFQGEDISASGMALVNNPRFIEQFGMLFQGGALFDSLKVWENICFSQLQSRSISKQTAQEIAAEKLMMVGLKPEVLYLYPAELSGGMQKRVALARAISANPKLIFFDEPTAGLDPISAHLISKLIADLTQNMTTITITHDMRCVREIADRIAMLKDGKITWQGNKDELDDPSDAYVEQFVTGG